MAGQVDETIQAMENEDNTVARLVKDKRLSIIQNVSDLPKARVSVGSVVGVTVVPWYKDPVTILSWIASTVTLLQLLVQQNVFTFFVKNVYTANILESWLLGIIIILVAILKVWGSQVVPTFNTKK